ncbi:MAG: helix-turn-helix transcriptional regulator [Planctomycetaceae bacterium]|nr:helix-turn-helix transcriptional regulator [Planctomycetaceae bacterium]
MKSESSGDWRSQCPLNIALELLGDRWTLLILRDLMFKKFTTYKEFQNSGEGIATNILADRLKKLVELGLITGERSEADARVMTYQPTEKGLDLLPTMVELMIWTDKYEKHAAPPHIMKQMKRDPQQLIAAVREQFTGKLNRK